MSKRATGWKRGRVGGLSEKVRLKLTEHHTGQRGTQMNHQTGKIFHKRGLLRYKVIVVNHVQDQMMNTGVRSRSLGSLCHFYQEAWTSVMATTSILLYGWRVRLLRCCMADTFMFCSAVTPLLTFFYLHYHNCIFFVQRYITANAKPPAFGQFHVFFSALREEKL